MAFVKPGLLESRVAESPETFNRLGEGFQRLFLETSVPSQNATAAFGAKLALTSGSPKPIVLPIAGYTGHRKGEASENLFGKCFRDVTIKSKIIERGGLQRQRNPYLIQRPKLSEAGNTITENAQSSNNMVQISAAERPPMPGRYTDTRVFKGGNRTFGTTTLVSTISS
jgi:hypothetical protein